MLVDQASIASELIREVVFAVSGVVEVASPCSRSDGGLAAVDVVVRVARDLDTVASHEIASDVERAIREQLPVEAVVVHVEPERQEGEELFEEAPPTTPGLERMRKRLIDVLVEYLQKLQRT